MKKFNKVLKEINFTFSNIILFNGFLNAFLIFLVLYIPLSLFNFYQIYSLVPAVLYFIIFSYKGIRKKHLRDVEKKYHLLNERLRTAADNIKIENPVVDELKSDIIRDMKHVEVTSFFNQKKVSYKILLSIILCFLIVFSAQFDISFNFKNIADNAVDFIYGIGGNNTDGGKQGLERIAGSGESENVFGDAYIAQMGDEMLDMFIKQAGYEINLDDVKEPERREFEEIFPDEVFIATADVYEEKIQEEQQELVKTYFLKLAKG
ncbi:MAG: hypothetical protein KKA61_00615 [Nanoarchaeota archaeon]|nr:hypothetical protein [Nanoarchaeota archaeon]